jgi:Fur family peroxide stress response transcriptional regulator
MVNAIDKHGIRPPQAKRHLQRNRQEVARWCARFEEQCRTRGLRFTTQRLAVYRALAQDASHPTAESVYARLKLQMTSLSFATVYRILERLEDEGLIRRVSTAKGVRRFDANLEPHQHFVCRLCNGITDHAELPHAQLPLPWRGPRGFTAEELEIRIVGICGSCRRARAKRGLARSRAAS